MYVYTYYIHYVRIYVCIILLKTVVTTAFCRFLRKKLRPRATSASTFPSPSLPSYFRQKKIARTAGIRPSRIPNARDFSRARIRARRSFTVRWRPPIVRFSDCFRFLFSLFSSFFPSRPKIVGRRTRVIGQGSKTWKGYRNSLFPPFLSSFLSFVAISRFSFFLSVLPLSFSSLLTALGEKKK